MPDRYVLDAHAWVEYLRGSPPGKRVKELIKTGEVYTSAVTLAEVVSHVTREGQDADLAARAVQTLSETVPLDSDMALKAAKRYAQMKKGSLEQAYLQEIAKKFGAYIVSGDSSFVSGRAIHVE